MQQKVLGGKPKNNKLKTLGIRAISGVALLAMCGLPIYFGGLPMALLVLLFGLRIGYEWVRMTDKNANMLAFAFPWIGLIATLALVWFNYWGIALLLVVIFAILAFFERIARDKKSAITSAKYKDNKGTVSKGLGTNHTPHWAWFGIFYVLLPSLAIFWLRGFETMFVDKGQLAIGFQRFIFVLLTVIAADTFAYLGGSTIGGPKLAPKISPNKTWAGFFSGIAGGAFIGALLALWFGFSPLKAALLAVPIVLFAVAGDFLESWVKRRIGVKDAGRLLPGHGGLLDRIDSLLLASFITSLALYFWPNLWPQA